MRWHVHGTDINSSRGVTLSVEAVEAKGAVQAAMAKGILVSHVTKGPRLRILSIGLATAVAGVLILGAGCALLQWREGQTRSELAASQAEAGRLAAALTESGGMVTALQRRTAALEEAHGGAAKALVDKLDAAEARAKALGDELAAAKVSIGQLETRAAGLEKQTVAIDPLRKELAQTRDQVADAQAHATEIQQQLSAEQQRVVELQKARAATAGMEQTNQELLAQNEQLKTQLLDQVAKSVAVPVSQVVEAPVPPARPLRWSLQTSFDAASDFMALHFEKESAGAAVVGDGTVMTSGMLTANAASLRLFHDVEKKHVYSVILTVSLAADAPKEKRAENQKLLSEFVRQFAPSFKDPEVWLAEAAKQLAGKDITDRAVRMGDDYKLTVWNNRLGLYSWKIESPRGDLDE